MHPDAHLYVHHARAAELHHARAAELRRAATAGRPRGVPLRSQLGWTLVELGLRLVSSSGPSHPSAGLAARRPYSPA